jgi:hypothetical protein
MAKGKKTGGRQQGSTNKISSHVREVIAAVVDDYYNSKTFLDDIKELEPRDRVLAMEKLTSYVTAKLQSTSLDVNADAQRTIEDKLRSLSGDDEEEKKE